MANQRELIAAYETHRLDIISRLVSYHGMDCADAEDALQDVMLQTIDKWEVVKSTLKNWGSDDLPHYLFKGALNRCKDLRIQYHHRSNRETLYFG